MADPTLTLPAGVVIPVRASLAEARIGAPPVRGES
jgi:hypothetical protein